MDLTSPSVAVDALAAYAPPPSPPPLPLPPVATVDEREDAKARVAQAKARLASLDDVDEPGATIRAPLRAPFLSRPPVAPPTAPAPHEGAAAPRATRAPPAVASAALPPAQATRSFPATFYCPISFAIMRDPVYTVGGEVYERAPIERWLRTHGQVSPLTGAPLGASTLVPNEALAMLIRQSGALDAPAAPPPMPPAPPPISVAISVLAAPSLAAARPPSSASSGSSISSTVAEGDEAPSRPLTQREKLALWKEQKQKQKSSPASAPAAGAAIAAAAPLAARSGAVAGISGSTALEPRAASDLNSQRTRPQQKKPLREPVAAKALKGVAAAALPVGAPESTDAVTDLLRAHNARVRKEMALAGTLPSYEPRTASVADIRAWEKRTGQKFADLNSDERWMAQQEILAINAQLALQQAANGLPTY